MSCIEIQGNPVETVFIEQKIYKHLSVQVKLGEPLEDLCDNRINTLSPNEKSFAQLLLGKGLYVFPEPEILGIIQTPDFYICNPSSFYPEKLLLGSFVELTLSPREEIFSRQKGYGSKRYARKRRQCEAFASIGLPVIYLCREEQESIRKYQDYRQLF